MNHKTAKTEDQYSEAEAARRRDAIIKNMIATPPTPHAPAKGKRKRRLAKRSTAKPRKSE